MTTGKALNGKPYAGNPHVRFDEGEVASAATPRRGSLLYKTPPKKSTLTSRARTASASLAAAMLAAFTASAATMTQLVNGPSDIRVAPLVEASWAQGAVGGSPCYNSKTPDNCLCGCVATAAGQIMRKWQYPAAAAVKVTNTLSVNGTDTSCTMLGGPGVSYDWANMPFSPANEASLTTAQREAIGTLLYDIGVAAKMAYTTDSSATSTSLMFEQFTETFGYSNAAIVGNPAGTGLSLEQFTQAVLPSLDAGMPVMVGIGGANTAHSVLCDGYGYQDGDLYIHINMGQGNNDTDSTKKFNNTWYKFPTNNPEDNGVSLWPGTGGTGGEQSYLNPAIYNISPTIHKGWSIVSGRVFSDGNAVNGATVVALNTSGTEVATATSNDKGIYALILPAGTYTLRATTSEKGARRLASVSATAGSAKSDGGAENVTIGNQHGVDFDLTETASDVIAAGLLAEKPDEILDFVESGYNQYVDTGVIGKDGTKAEIKMSWTVVPDAVSGNGPDNGSHAFLASYGNNKMFYLLRYLHNAGYNNTYTGYNGRWGNNNFVPVASTIYSIVSEITSTGHNIFTVDNVQKRDYNYTENAPVNTGCSLYLFARNKSGTADSFVSGRCYGLRIWQIPDGGTDYVLVRDFVPCRKNGVAGLYDRVDKKIFYSASGTALVAGPVTSPGLVHRWSFNGNLNDSAGSATAQPVRSWYESNSAHVTVGDGVEPVFDGNAVKLGAENYTTSGKATSLNLGTGLVTTNDVTIEIWATRRSIQSYDRLFDWGDGGLGSGSVTAYVCLPWINNPVIWTHGCTSGNASSDITGCFANETKYHLTFTVTQDGTSSKYHLVRRKADELSAKPLQLDHTVTGWTLSKVIGGRLYLGHSQWPAEAGNDANATYDEVRIWNGVVPDALLALNAAMGPDALVLRYDADGKACFDIPAGATLPINANTIGNGYTLAGSVTFGAGAKIEFDTANNPAGMSFTAEGGFTGVTAENVANYVTHTSTAAYDVTLSGNKITVTPARLAHRWSFNGDLKDSAGTADATTIGNAVAIENGEVVMTGNGNSTGSLNLGKGVVPTGNATIEIWATRTGVKNWGRVFDYGTGTRDYFMMSWSHGTDETGDNVSVCIDGGQNNTFDTMKYVNDKKYHISATATVNADGSTTISWAKRDVTTGEVLNANPSSCTQTRAGWTLAKLAEGIFYLGHSQWSTDLDANATYDEVRIWNGVVPDELLALNADMGPDTMALKYDANGIASVVVPDGKTLHVNENTVGDYTLAGSVTLEGSARIEFNFNTTLYPNGMSFAAQGGFTVPSGSVADYVTVPEGYDVTLSGNTISVAPATTTSWTGAAGDGDWNNAANWTKGVPTDSKDATILASATTMPLTVPANAAYASFTVAGGALAANTDWSGLAQKPVISGTVDLNGHDLTMPSVGITIAQSGASFVNSAATTNEVLVSVSSASGEFNETAYIDGLPYLSVGSGVSIVALNASSDISADTLKFGNFSGNSVYRQNDGSLTLGTANQTVTLGSVAGSTGVLDLRGGTATFKGMAIAQNGVGANGTLNISGTANLTATWLDMGYGGNGATTVNQTGGTAQFSDNILVGRGASQASVYNLGGGELRQTGGIFVLSYDNNSKGAFNMTGGSLNTSGAMSIGRAGVGTFTQSGGDVYCGNDVVIGDLAAGTGTYVLNGGKITPKYWQWVGNYGTGTFIQNGGTNHVWGSNNNVLAISGRGGSGTYVMNGGLLEVQSYIRVGGWHNPGTGVLEVNGGTIITPSIDRTQLQGSSTVKLNGGTIKASANDGNILKSIGNVVFGSNATTIDTDGHNTAITGCGYDTVPGSSLVKAGAGTLTVDAMPPVNTLTVSNGVFALSAAADNNIAGRTLDIVNGATVDLGGFALTQPVIAGAGTVQNGTLNVTEKLSPGGDGVVGTIAINSTAVVTGTIRLDDGDTITTTGSVDLSNATIDLAFTPTVGYTVATASGSGSFTGLPAFTLDADTSEHFALKPDGTGIKIVMKLALTQPDGGSLDVEAGDTDLLSRIGLTSTATPSEVNAFLNATDPNGLRRWENLVTGTATNQPPLGMVSAETASGKALTLSVKMAADTNGIDKVNLGYEVLRELRKGDGTRVAGPSPDGTAFDIGLLNGEGNSLNAAGLYRVVTLLAYGAVTNEIPSTNAVGIVEVASTATNTITAVPWKRLASAPGAASDLTVSNFVAYANLSDGDAVYMLDGRAYKMWKKINGKWEAATTVSGSDTSISIVQNPGDPDVATIPCGGAVWVQRADATKPYFLVGQYDESAFSVTVPGSGAALIANPFSTNVTLNAINWSGYTGVNKDTIRIPRNGLHVDLSYKNGKWGYYTDAVINNGVFTGATFAPYEEPIPAGTGFIYDRKGGEGFTFEWK